MSRSIEGQSAIVTGAGGGINLEFARLLLRQGVNVLIADLALRPEAEEVIKEYQTRPIAIFQKTDVTSWRDLDAMFVKAQECFSQIDIVCPGAGVFEPPWSSFWYPPGTLESKDDPFGNHYKSLEINLTHPVRVTQMAMDHFFASAKPPSLENPKCVIHVASLAGEMASFIAPLYHASKWGLVGFIHSMASMESRFGIRVAGVAPGIVKSPLWDHADKAKLVNKAGASQRDWITAEKVAQIMLDLVIADRVVGIDGEEIQVQGGLILEVGTAHIRQVTMTNNVPRVDQPGMALTNSADAVANVAEQIGKLRVPKSAS